MKQVLQYPHQFISKLRNTNKLLLIIVLPFVVGCVNKKNSNISSQLTVKTIFPNSQITSYKIRYFEDTKLSKIYLNDDYVKDIYYLDTRILDSIKLIIPSEFQLVDSASSLCVFEDMIENRIIFQLLISKFNDALELFNDMYQHSVKENYKFNLISGVYIETKDRNLVFYDLELSIKDELRYILGIICTKDGNKYFDFSLTKDTQMQDIDRFVFTELVNSIFVNKKSLTPEYSEIDAIKNIEIH